MRGDELLSENRSATALIQSRSDESKSLVGHDYGLRGFSSEVHQESQ